jgi:hypothetical protein
MATEQTGERDAADDAAPSATELATRLADVVFEWWPPRSSPLRDVHPRWMSRTSHANDPGTRG